SGNGRTEFLPLAFVAAFSWNRFGDFDDTKKVCAYVLDQTNGARSSTELGRTLFFICGFAYHVISSLRETWKLLERGVDILTQNGDLVFTGFALLYLGNVRTLAERKLETLDEGIDKYLKAIRRNGDDIIYYSLLPFQLMAKSLQGKTLAADTFSTP